MTCNVSPFRAATRKFRERFRWIKSSMDNNLDLDPLSRRVCGMTLGQQVRILKKFCDNNPADTHRPFEVIVFFAFGELPSKSKSECNKIINRALRNP